MKKRRHSRWDPPDCSRFMIDHTFTGWYEPYIRFKLVHPSAFNAKYPVTWLKWSRNYFTKKRTICLAYELNKHKKFKAR